MSYLHCLFVRFVFTSCCLQEGACLIYVVCLFGSSLPPVVCRSAHVLFTLFVCSVRLYLLLFAGGLMFHLCYLCLRIVVSNKCCVVFLLCFSSSCVSYLACYFGLSIFDCPFCILKRLFIDKIGQGQQCLCELGEP
jgi:hypothetical protein